MQRPPTEFVTPVENKWGAEVRLANEMQGHVHLGTFDQAQAWHRRRLQPD